MWWRIGLTILLLSFQRNCTECRCCVWFLAAECIVAPMILYTEDYWSMPCIDQLTLQNIGTRRNSALTPPSASHIFWEVSTPCLCGCHKLTVCMYTCLWKLTKLRYCRKKDPPYSNKTHRNSPHRSQTQIYLYKSVFGSPSVFPVSARWNPTLREKWF